MVVTMTEVQLDRFTKQGQLTRNWSRDVLNVLVSVYLFTYGLVNVKLVSKYSFEIQMVIEDQMDEFSNCQSLNEL